MTAATEELKTRLAKLPPADRAGLAHYLIDILDTTVDPDAESAGKQELARREIEIRSGATVGEPCDSVFARMGDRRS